MLLLWSRLISNIILIGILLLDTQQQGGPGYPQVSRLDL